MTRSPLTVVIASRGWCQGIDQLLQDLVDQSKLNPAITLPVRIELNDSWNSFTLNNGDKNHEETQTRRAPTTSAAANRNLGWRQSGSDWVCFLDDDVRLESNWLNATLAEIENPGAPDLLGGKIGSLCPNNWFSQAAEYFVIRHKKYPTGWHLVSAHLFVRDKALSELDGFNERFSGAGDEDWDFSMRAHSHALTVGVSRSIQVKHANPTNWSQLSQRAKSYGAGQSKLSAALPQATNHNTESLDLQVEASSASPLTNRILAWAPTQFGEFRALGRSRIRSMRSTAIYIP